MFLHSVGAALIIASGTIHEKDIFVNMQAETTAAPHYRIIEKLQLFFLNPEPIL